MRTQTCISFLDRLASLATKGVALMCVIVVLVFTASCSSSGPKAEVLAGIEQTLSVSPSSALATLEGIDPAGFESMRDKAYYSLYYSMALEKNSIYVRTDTIIAPAVEYFMKKGSPELKLQARYYQARAYENCDLDEDAMSAIIDGERFLGKTRDYDLRAKFMLKKAALYGRIYDYRNALANASKARDEYKKANDAQGYVTAVLAMSNYCQFLSDFATSKKLLAEVKDRWGKINDSKKAEYYRQMINYSMAYEGTDASELREEYLASGVSRSDVYYLVIVDSFLAAGMPENAESALRSYVSASPEKIATKEYQLRLAKLEELKGNYKESLTAYKTYHAMSSAYDQRIIRSDTGFVEERLAAAEVQRRDHVAFILLIVAILSIVGVSSLLILSLKNRNEHLGALYQELETEKASLESIKKEGVFIENDTLSVINERLNLINEVIIQYSTGSNYISKKVESKLEEIASDKDKFLYTTATLISCSYPDFVSHLKEKGLTEWEIGFCCLYILGLSGKEVKSYMDKGSTYNINSKIRQKLGLSSTDMNLDKYLKSLIANSAKN